MSNQFLTRMHFRVDSWIDSESHVFCLRLKLNRISSLENDLSHELNWFNSLEGLLSHELNRFKTFAKWVDLNQKNLSRTQVWTSQMFFCLYLLIGRKETDTWSESVCPVRAYRLILNIPVTLGWGQILTSIFQGQHVCMYILRCVSARETWWYPDYPAISLSSTVVCEKPFPSRRLFYLLWPLTLLASSETRQPVFNHTRDLWIDSPESSLRII